MYMLITKKQHIEISVNGYKGKIIIVHAYAKIPLSQNSLFQNSVLNILHAFHFRSSNNVTNTD